MPFAYYKRLTTRQRQIYRESDAVAAIPLPGGRDLLAQVDAVREALETGDRTATQMAADRLLAAIADRLDVPPLRTQILEVRPAKDWGELHGLYTTAFGGRAAQVQVWMRTAQRRQVVRFRTFFRTLLHELCHHLDYELFRWPDSFHTEGFYKRETSLLKQLLPAGAGGHDDVPRPDAPNAGKGHHA